MAKTRKLPSKIPSVTGVEIFRVGKHPGSLAGKPANVNFTEADLDAVAASYNPSVHDAPITKDHIDKGPSFGWVSKVYRKGESLWADFRDVSSSLVREIRDGSYEKRSAEIYPSFSKTGTPYLRAVTFCGAQIPAVKGMEPIKFADEFGDYVACDLDEVARFADAPMPPDGATFDVLVKTERTESNLGHWHDAYLDASGNGYTSGPICYDDNYNLETEDDGHQHVVVGGQVMPSEDAETPKHNHQLTLVVTMSETIKETPTMSEPEKKTPEATVNFAEQIADVEKRATAAEAALKATNDALAAAKAEIDGMRVARFNESEDRRLASVLDECGESILPAEVPAIKATFNALPPDDKPIKFGEGAEAKDRGARELFLDSLLMRKKVIRFGEIATPSQELTLKRRAEAGLPDDTRRDSRALEIVAKFAEAGEEIEYGAAVVLALREENGEKISVPAKK